MSLLSVRDLSLSFGGVRALSDLSFDVEEGEILSIIGPNGAGKTTIFNLLSRLYEPDAGRLTFAGQELTDVPPHGIAALGIARTFQNTELFEHASVLDNLLIGCHVHRRTSVFSQMLFLPSVRRQELEFRKVAEDVIDLLDLAAWRHHVIEGLPYGVRKMVEIARALCVQPSLLLLDEPSSGLNPEETEDLSFWLEDINEELGITVLMVEHDMSLVAQASDRVLAVADGQFLAIGTVDEVRNHPDVQRAYLGDDAAIGEPS